MASDSGNPEGYFEQRSIAGLNDEILKYLGGRWDSPPLLAPGWANELGVEDFLLRAKALLASSYASRRYVLKDPRISLLLPLWRQAVLDRSCAVLIVREPSEVAWSLALRNAMPALTGLALWAAYNRALLSDLSGLPVHVCSYSDLVESPAEVLGSIRDSLEAWGEISPGTDLANALARIKPDLRRNTKPASEPDLMSPPAEMVNLLKTINDLRGRHDTFEVGADFSPGWWEGPLLEERRTTLQRTDAQLAELRTLNDNLVAENIVLRTDNVTVRAELDHVTAQVRRIKRFVPTPLYRSIRRRFSRHEG